MIDPRIARMIRLPVSLFQCPDGCDVKLDIVTTSIPYSLSAAFDGVCFDGFHFLLKPV
jgi:hypothetical protein